MSDQPPKEFLDIYAWFNKKKTKIGYAFRTDRQTLRLKADPHLDAVKIGRALMNGIEVEQRQPPQRREQGRATPQEECEDFSEAFQGAARTKAGAVRS
jgi:hypothetical protein